MANLHAQVVNWLSPRNSPTLRNTPMTASAAAWWTRSSSSGPAIDSWARPSVRLGPSHPQQQVVQSGHCLVIGRSPGLQTPDPRLPESWSGIDSEPGDSWPAGRIQVTPSILNGPPTKSPGQRQSWCSGRQSPDCYPRSESRSPALSTTSPLGISTSPLRAMEVTSVPSGRSAEPVPRLAGKAGTLGYC